MPDTRICHLVFNRVQQLPPLVHELAWMRGRPWRLDLVAPGYGQDEMMLARTLPHVRMLFTTASVRALSPHPHPALKLARYAEFIVRALAAVVRLRPAVVVAHDLTVMPVALAARAATGCRVVYNAHEIWSEASEDNAPLRPLWRRLERWAVAHADRIVVPEPNRARILRDEYGARTEPVLVRNIPPAAAARDDSDAGSTAARTRALHEKLSLGEDAVIVLYQGLVAASRCLLEAAQAVALLPPHHHLVVIGGGDDAYRAELERAADASGGRVHVLPFVPYEELAAFTASADIGMLLYRNDGRNNFYAAPNKLYEYLFAGLAVVSSDFPGLRATVVDGGYGACADPADPAAIADAIVRADALRADTGRANRARAEFRFDDEMARLEAMYDGMLEEQR